MRKLVLLGAVVVVLGCVLSSCKSHERCPAYGKTNPIEQADKSV